MGKRILLIVEGEADEVSFFKRLFNTCNKLTEFHLYSYKTNIHIIAQELNKYYPDFENDQLNIQNILASLEQKQNKKELLLANYTDVYMIFDFEPQHNNPHFDIVRRMLNYFNDPTLHGKLYINYPMMQSYKHFDKLPCSDFEEYKVSLEDCKKYKENVGKMSKFTDLNHYDYIIFYSITVHQLKKANRIVKNDYSLPTVEEYFNLDLVELFDIQLNYLKMDYISIINTCIFVLIDFAPNKFFSFVIKNQDNLLI